MTATTYTTQPMSTFDRSHLEPLHELSSVGYTIRVGAVDAGTFTEFAVYPVRKNLVGPGAPLDHVAVFVGPAAQASAVAAAFNQIAEDLAAETGNPEPTISVDGNMAVAP